MRGIIFSLFVLSAAGVVSAPAAYAEESSRGVAAKSFVEKNVNEIRETIRKDRGKIADKELERKLEDQLRPLFDFEEMSKSSLGANWTKATPGEQEEFVSLFTQLLAKSYLKKIYDNIETSEINFLKPVERDTSVVVKTMVTNRGDDIAIDYRMRLMNGAWRVYDVVIENVGLVSNYRNEFAPIVRKEKMTGLISKLREKTVHRG